MDSKLATQGRVRLVALQREALSIGAIVEAVQHPRAGAIDLFVGVVREDNDGRAVVRLDYSAYASMALREMQRIAEEVALQTDALHVAVVHRLGSLAVGDIAVLCAASAPHRGEAFAATRTLIDRIKADVPIWKREYGPDGAYWVGWQSAQCTHAAEQAHTAHKAHSEHSAAGHRRDHGEHVSIGEERRPIDEGLIAREAHGR